MRASPGAGRSYAGCTCKTDRGVASAPIQMENPLVLRSLAALASPSLAALALLSLAALPAAATTISFQNGAGGYAAADNESFSFDGSVSQDRIRIDLPNESHPEDRYAWVIFEGIVGDGLVPAGATILSATLEGWVTNPFGSASLTWLLDDIANRPNGPGASILDVAGSFYDAAGISASHPGGCATTSLCDPPVFISWDVTAIVQAWADGAANHGFLLLPETTNGGNLATTDALDPSLRPRLVVQYDSDSVSVAEPGGLALLALGLAGLAAYGRPRGAS